MNVLQQAIAAKAGIPAADAAVVSKDVTVATIDEVKAMTASETIHAEVIKPPKDSYTIIKRNMFVNATGNHIKAVHDYLIPRSDDEKSLCAEWVLTGHLKKN